VTTPEHAIIWDEPTEGIWRWSAGRKARFVEYGGRQRALETARAKGAVFALWGPAYGYAGAPGDATREKLERCVTEAAERAAAHPHG
jgi:hypothetical protein